jgi:hypothetical protein
MWTARTVACGLSTENAGATWWTAAENREDERDRRDRERRRAEILPLMLAAESMRMKGKRAAWRQRDATINELFPAGTYAARG